jgi:hypothetical protein
LKADVFPAIGKFVSDIPPELVAMVKAIASGAWTSLPSALCRPGQVFRHAIAHGWHNVTPATDIKPAADIPGFTAGNYARLDERAARVVKAQEAHQGAPVTRGWL